jgi:hypothetical protein
MHRFGDKLKSSGYVPCPACVLAGRLVADVPEFEFPEDDMPQER